jgi:hypothetical protein
MSQPVDDDSENNSNSKPPLIKFIRLNTGEDIISEIVKYDQEDEDFYLLVNPLKIIYSISKSHGGISIALMQWIFPRICDKQEFTLYSNDIITMSNPSEQMETYYWNVLNKFDDMGFVLSPSGREQAPQYGSYDDIEEDENDDIDPTEEELEYINKMLEEVKNGKRKLH